MAEEYLQRVYDLQTQDQTDAYYSAWAATYDDEVARQGYRTPERCAQALARFVPLDATVLDIGCGTGVSGAALIAAGFTNITGQDVNAEMLLHARRTGNYLTTHLTDPATPFPFEAGTYAAMAAVGVIGVGAAPASVLREALDALDSGGHIVFSYNDHALGLPEYPAVVDDALESGVAEQLLAERGPHFEGLGTRSTVYVLRRR
jgi:predicted TPR repeat methyltransferase